MTLKSAFYNRCYGGRKPQWERGSSERSLLELYRAPYVQRLATLAYELVTACFQGIFGHRNYHLLSRLL
jgi:hypothetical protein